MGSLNIENVKKSFGQIDVLKGIDLDVADGEFVVFVGPSGSSPGWRTPHRAASSSMAGM
jgi:ABC-type sugar transport system ATPase subunit